MEEYKPRKIEFKEIIKTEGWSIKIYTISMNRNFYHPQFYKKVKTQLPKWLSMENNFDSTNDKMGFLILHSGTEGIFSLINWWVGKNMLNTNIFITNPKEPEDFTKISGNGLAPCIWELHIIYHESTSWLNNILKNELGPNYPAYLKDVYNGTI